jgi:D-alanyl-D-alanine carboxypeptidase/D-alanyl-D-alanine-endopeptidase (penicillin-binding protein 4)
LVALFYGPAVAQDEDETDAPSAELGSTRPPPAPKPIDFEAQLSPITKDKTWTLSKVGVQVVHVPTGKVVFQRDWTRPLIPASTMKIVTAAAALRRLGPAYRFRTQVLADGPIDANGQLTGNLYVKGGGDPTLVVEKLWKFLLDVKLAGVTRITGDVVFDESFFDTTYVLPGWDKRRDLEDGPAYFSSVSALSINHNTVGIVVAPGAEVGQAARVVLETPAGDSIVLKNQVVTVGESGRRQLVIDRKLDDKKNLEFTVTGTVPTGDEVKKYYRTVVDPTAQFIAIWQELAKVHGIEVKGKHRRGATPDSAEVVAELRSPSLASILADMNKSSSNFIAEQVVKTLGAELGDGGTHAAGMAVVASYLKDIQVPDDQRVLVNGSGLATGGTLSPAALTAVLLDMAKNDRIGPEFSASLAVAGWDGTLWRRFTEDPGRVRGKTGSIDGVAALTGYVTAGDGERYAFALILNELRGGGAPARRLQDRFLRRMFNVDDI